VNIEGIPAYLTRGQLQTVLAPLGIALDDLREITFDRDGVHAVVYARGPRGERRWLNPGGEEVAMHSIDIPVRWDEEMPSDLEDAVRRFEEASAAIAAYLSVQRTAEEDPS
jgi:hypothetical protein